MARTIATKLIPALCALAVALPIAAALYLAHHQSMQEESDAALMVASEVLRRSMAAGDQAISAEDRLRDQDGDPCSDAAIARMRDIDMASSYLQLVGYVADGRLICSSMGRHGDGIPLGPVEYVSRLGTRVRRSVPLGLGEGKRFLVLERHHYAAAIHPEMVTDIYPVRPELSLGLYGSRSGLLMSGRGPFDPAAEPRLRTSKESVFFNGKYLIAIQRSNRYDITAYAAVPVALLRGRLYAFAVVLIPIGLLVGAGLVFACLYLARQQASLPSLLRGALKRREFALHYQPIVDLRTGRMAGAEALLRWTRGNGEVSSPEVFIPAAEDCGLIRLVTRYVLEKVAVDAVRLLQRWPDAYISLNISSSDLQSGDIVESLRTLVATPGIEPRNIVVETTEYSFVDPDNAGRVVREIRALGIRVAIDDFGTGFSSLSLLTRLQTDYLKIDKIFVEAVGTDSPAKDVALHIIRMAESLGLDVIGEGVETQAQAAFLREHGVRFAQGWLYAKAMPVDQLLAWRAEQDAAATDPPAG